MASLTTPAINPSPPHVSNWIPVSRSLVLPGQRQDTHAQSNKTDQRFFLFHFCQSERSSGLFIHRNGFKSKDFTCFL